MKTWIIYKREFLNIVRKWSFWLATFLVPLSMAAVFAIQIFATLNVEKEQFTVIVPQDEAYEITQHLKGDGDLSFEFSALPMDSLRARIWENKHLILMKVGAQILDKPTGHATLYNLSNLNLQVVNSIEKRLSRAIKQYKQAEAGISSEQLEALEFDLSMDSRVSSPEEEKTGTEGIATIVGIGTCFLMYMLMFIYGSVLMQGVIEEKANRIVEVVVSSVKPFQLMLGKTLAIASVGLFQFLLWGILSLLVFIGVMMFTVGLVDPADLAQTPGAGGQEVEAMQGTVERMIMQAQNFNWGMLMWAFPVYFLGGFFLYGTLWAAAGASVDNIQDAQQFTLPISLPLIIPMLFVYNIVQNPNSTLAFIFSMVPFSSPMAMLVRLSTSEVPWYEIALSILLLIGGFLACIWIAARIYRVGILMYGKKPSFKELFRWIKYRN